MLKKILPTIMEEIMLELELPVVFDGTKLTKKQKGALRSQARRGRDKIAGWVKNCHRGNSNTPCQLHHVIPLQYAHHIKGFNPNRNDNMLLLNHGDHVKIHNQLKARLSGLPVGSWQFKKALVKFYRDIKRDPTAFTNAKVPAQYGGKSILKEIIEELNL